MTATTAKRLAALIEVSKTDDIYHRRDIAKALDCDGDFIEWLQEQKVLTHRTTNVFRIEIDRVEELLGEGVSEGP